MRTDITVAAEARASRGKNEARRTRRAGMIPAVVYGAYKDPVPVAVNPKADFADSAQQDRAQHDFQSERAGRREHAGDGGRRAVRSHQGQPAARRSEAHRSYQAHPRFGPGHHAGRSPRASSSRAACSKSITREVEIECLPDEIPEHFTVDVSRADDRPKQARQRHCR